MRSIGEYIRLYFIIEATYIKASMQYRADFLISSVGMFFSSLATLSVFWIILESVPDLTGWSLTEMVFIYAFYMIAISPTQILFDHFWQLRFHIQQGTFLKYYFRPLNMMFYYMMSDLKGLTQLVVGIGLLVYSSIQLDLDWTIARFFLLLLTLFSAALVQISIVVAASCAAFWVIDSYPVLGAGMAFARILPLPHDHLRWRIPLHVHTHHSDRRCSTFHLLLSRYRHWTLRPYLLDLDQGRQLLHWNRILINGY